MNVSIIVPIYNAQDFILDCLHSIEHQTMVEGVECILVDDCSTDNSVNLAKRFIEEYKGDIYFTLLYQNHNQGPSAARNAGIRKATGDYIFFLDSDDKITPDCIELLYDLAQQNNADYIQGTYESNEAYHMPVYGQEMPEFTDDRKYIKRTLLNYNIVPFTPHNRLVRRQLILENNLFFNEKIIVREDFLWMSFIAKFIKRLCFCKTATYLRGYNNKSLTHNININREITGYRTLIVSMCENVDSFERGSQMELILNTFCMMSNLVGGNEDILSPIRARIMRRQTFLERYLLVMFCKTKNNKFKNIIFHLLIRLYKIID